MVVVCIKNVILTYELPYQMSLSESYYSFI